MAEFTQGEVDIHYDVEGNSDGPTVLILAPGGLRSSNVVWENMPWNPRVSLADDFRVIGMDQRNAGRSTAPVSPNDGWADYTADQLALLDHLEIESCHLLGMCIGGPFIAALLQSAPERFHSAVMLQPVGIDDNTEVFIDLFDGWADEIAPAHPEADSADWASYRANMWDGSFMLTATPEDIEQIDTPLLVMMGNDIYHPESTSREVARRAPNATLVEFWKEPEHLDRTNSTIHEFLAEHSPL